MGMTPNELLQTIQQAKAEGWKQLDLSDRGLTELPDAIGELTALESLYLFRNELTQFPSEIRQLTKLTQLDLSNNRLSDLPPEIEHLTNLSYFYLSGNQLSDLPPEIGQLAKLTQLDLGNNQLSDLPPEIEQLTNLIYLDLSENQLSDLPPEIEQLTNLTEIYLNDNQLSAFPPEIVQLTNLNYLTLRDNQLSTLPSEIRKLAKLKMLDLRENPMPIPPEILAKWHRPAEILKFYFETAKRPLNEAKLLVVGQGSVGKTSLVNRLLRDRFNLQENKTEGINIQQWPVEGIQLNVWDFGGQEIMHATHQFFLTQRSLYLLVLDTRLGEDENRLEYWLKIIQSFGADSPVIVVGNKSDQQALDLDRRGLQDKYPSIKAFVETSCKDGTGIEALKTAICQEIHQLAHVKDELPLSWFDLKRELEDIDRDYMPYPEYQQLCQHQNIHDERDQELLVGFLHDLGVVLNFRDDPRLEDTNILNPVWVTNGVYQILNDNALMTAHKGMLDRTMLDRILEAERYPKTKHLFVIDMMRKFELCFDLVPDQQFLIPDLLSKEEPDTGDWSDSLAFQYHYNVLPGSIISRFIVRASRLISKKTYWRSGAVLIQDGSRALVKADREDKKIFIWVSGEQSTRRQLLGTIRSHFEHIHGTITGIEAEAMVTVPGSSIPVRYQHLRTLERNHVPTFIPDGLEKPVSVQALLEGVETQRLYLQRGRDFDRDRTPKPSLIQNFYGPVGSAGNQGEQQNIAGTTKADRISVQPNTATAQLTTAQVLELLAQLADRIQQDDQILNEADKAKATRYLEIAKTELEEEEEPNPQLIATSLERATRTLETAARLDSLAEHP